MRILWNILSFVFNFVPFFMIGYAWFFVPSMKLPITAPAPFEWLVYSMGLGIGWIAVQVWISTSRKTTTGMLQLDSIQGIFFALILTGVSGWMIGKGALPWMMVVPWGMTFLDALISSVLAINNAAQKPLGGGVVSQGKLTHGN